MRLGFGDHNCGQDVGMEDNKRGAPTKYKDEYVDQVYKLCLLGATDEELANFFEVNEATINRWKIKYPDFWDSIKKGKDIADAEVAESLYKRATGYEAPDVDIRVIESKIVETPLVKHYPPEPTAMIFWLKNRQRAKWRDRQDIDMNVDMSLSAEMEEARNRAKKKTNTGL